MKAKDIEKDLKKICETVSMDLVSIQWENTNVRISEQESRVLFCNAIEKEYNKKFYYAIEVPTEEKYNFTENPRVDPKGRSACSDLSLFRSNSNSDNRKFKQIVNIEFKAHNNVAVLDIMKDLLKLAAEPVHGLFLHTLKNINRGTLINTGRNMGVMDKYRKIKEYKKVLNKSIEEGGKFILFAICIIESQVLLMKTLRKSDLNSIDEFFSIDYEKIRENNLSGNNKNWEQKNLYKRKNGQRLIFPAYKN